MPRVIAVVRPFWRKSQASCEALLPKRLRFAETSRSLDRDHSARVIKPKRFGSVGGLERKEGSLMRMRLTQRLTAHCSLRRPAFRALFCGLAVLLSSSLVIADSDSRRPLDLPVRGVNNDEDEEDQPETILFYGSEFEGDGFFFCFPAFDF